jgi:hypothetical protein
MYKYFHICGLVLPFEKQKTEVLTGRTKQNVTNGPVPPVLLTSKVAVWRVGTDLHDPQAKLRWSMVIATLLLICSIPQMDDTAKVVNESPAVGSEKTTKDSALVASASLPSAPEPKVKADPEPITPNPAAQPFIAVKPVIARPRETPRQRKIWYGLLLAGHSGAAFDAWSTKRAVVGGYGQEANPFLRPFANSNAIYAATQVSPAFMDYLGKKMMVSEHGWLRKMWWLPQMAGASLSFASGAHNVGVVH